MKRWRWVSGLLVLAAIAWWWFRPAADGPRTSSGEAETVASSAAPGDGARLLNALQNAPLPPSEGELSIEGRVLDPAGEPVPDATVIATAGAGEDVLSAMRCHCDDECGRMLLECACPQSAVQLAEMVAERRGEAPPLARVRTDGEGRFSLTGLGEGRYAVWAEHGKRGIAVVARVGAGTQGITVHLQPGIALTGSTVDRDHHPVPGAVVTAVYVQNSRFFDAVTSEKGGFRLAPLPAGRYSVVVSADGYLPEHRSVGDDDSEPLSFTLSRPRAISGRVQRDGAPVAQARVEFYGAHRRLEVTTDAAGRFQATGLRAGEYSIQATQGGEIGATSVSLTPEADATGVEVALGPGGSVVGQVVDETGAPVVAEVRASRRYEYAAAPIRTKTDPQGHFSFSALLPGSYRISASAERFQRLEEAPTAETSRPAGPPVQITLKRGARVAGRVRDPDGKPIEGASVEVAGVPSRTTATDGTFAIEGAEPGTLKVTASHSGYLTTEQAVTAPSEAIELVLARGGRLTGKVLDENGAPVADAQVIATEQTQEAASQQAKTKADGTFLLEGLEDGSFEVSARTGDAENTREVHAQVELSGGAAAPLTLRFDPGFPLEGQVVDPAGRPIVGADVLISREGSSPIEVTIHPDLRARRELKSGADGHFRARYLPNLPLQVMAMKEGFGGGGLVKAKAGQADLRLVSNARIGRWSFLSRTSTSVTS